MNADRIVEARKRNLTSKWGKYERALRSAYPEISEQKVLNTLQLLENTNSQLEVCKDRLFEGTQPVDIGPFRRYAFDIITATMPNLIAEEVCSVQSLQQKLGQIFYLEYRYGTSKGGVTSGDVMLSPFTNSPGYSTYASESVTNELTGIAVANQAGNLAFVPVRPGTVRFNVDGEFVVDDGANVLTGTGALVGINGTIDYVTGEYDFTLGGAPAGDVSVDYDTDFETAPVNAPEVDLRVVELPIMARPRKLRTLYSFDAAYDLKVSQGIDIDEAMLMAVSGELKHETDGEILRDMYTQAGLTSTWNATYPPAGADVYISRREFNENFISEIMNASNQIFQRTRRAVGNFLIVGSNVATLLETVGEPRYKPSGVKNPVGPHFAGTLDGRIKVYKNPFYGPMEYLLGYKGELAWDTGFVYAPYLPLFMSNVLMLDDFVGRRGFATSYGKRMVNNNLYVRGLVTGTL